MKKQIIFALFVVLAVWAQDKSQVTVKNTISSNGVVLVTITENGKKLALQCTAAQAWCAELKSGDYQMVRLPKNHGLYDCQNVDVFKGDADVDNDPKLGEYCLSEGS